MAKAMRDYPDTCAGEAWSIGRACTLFNVRGFCNQLRDTEAK